jgi:formate/nitrite transporter FocA (FNT family)
MQCPKCSSDNTQKLKIIYESGTKEINTTGYSAGTGLGSLVGIGGAATKTTGRSQSLMAQRIAPPRKSSFKWPVISLIAGIVLLKIKVVLGATLITGGAGFIFLVWKHNTQQWPGLYKNWIGSWHCNKCGEIYLQQ